MSRQCPFPVRSVDSRCGYHASSVPGLSLCLALTVVLSCFAGLSYAGGTTAAQQNLPVAETGASPTTSIHISASR